MAKKMRKVSKTKARKPKRPKAKLRTKASSNTKKSKTKMTKRPSRKSRPKAKPKGIMEKVASAFRTIGDTIKETDTLRNKMEPPGVSETS